MTTKKNTKGSNAMSRADNKFSVDRIWFNVGIPALIWVFSAGIGWNQLSYAQESIKELKQEISKVKDGRDEAKDRLIVVETRLAEILRALDKQWTQLDALAKNTAKP